MDDKLFLGICLRGMNASETKGFLVSVFCPISVVLCLKAFLITAEVCKPML